MHCLSLCYFEVGYNSITELVIASAATVAESANYSKFAMKFSYLIKQLLQVDSNKD